MSATMKAVRLLAPDQLALEDLPRPEPGPGEVLVRIAAVGLCQTDVELLTGLHGAIREGLTHYPIVPCHEWSGYVVGLGEGVTHLREGDLVAGETGIGCLRCRLCLTGHHNICRDATETGILKRDGALREYHVQNATFVHRYPADDPAAAALVEPASVGLYSCLKAQVSPLDRVAVVGAGTIGQFCAQAARACGARSLLVVSRSVPKLRLAEQLGADRAVSSATEDLRAIADEMTGGTGFDVVIEAAGTAAAFDEALRLCGPAGRVAMVGLSSAAPYGFGLDTIIDREQTIIGVRGSPNTYPQTIDLIAKGIVQTAPLISHRFPFAQYQEAFAVARAGGAGVLKVLLTL